MQAMTSDERIIWAAVFAATINRIVREQSMTRGDLVYHAGTEADYTIEAIRRNNAHSNFEFVGGGERGFNISKPNLD